MKSGFKETEIGMIPEDWDVNRIGELVSINESNIKKDYSHKEIFYFDTSSVENGKILGGEKLALGSSPSRAKRIVNDNDILISTVRPNLKHFAFIKKAKPNMIASTGFAVITAKHIFPKYLYYYLSTDKFTKFLTAIADAHTSTYPSFNPDVISNSAIPCPHHREQRAIAKILGDLDAKIELNQQMNRTLEAMAQAIFKQWFVDFKFPGHEKTKFINGLPEGWKKTNLKEVAEVVGGGTPSTKEESYYCQPGKGIAWISPRDLSGYAHKYISHGASDITEEGLKNSSAKVMPEDSILMSSRAPIGYVAIAGNVTATNQGFKSLVPNQFFYVDYLFYWLKFNMPNIEAIASGSTFKEVSGSAVKNFRLVMPNDTILRKFSDFMKPINGKAKNMLGETQNLIKIRDSLLPRLMSGKIRVKT